MADSAVAGLSAPDAPPIDGVAHSLLRDALGELGAKRSERDVKLATAIVRDATELIAENIFLVALDQEDLGWEGCPDDAGE